MRTGMKLLYVFSQGLAASHNFPSYISHSRRVGCKKSFLTVSRICQRILKTRNGPLGQELSRLHRKPTKRVKSSSELSWKPYFWHHYQQCCDSDLSTWSFCDETSVLWKAAMSQFVSLPTAKTNLHNFCNFLNEFLRVLLVLSYNIMERITQGGVLKLREAWKCQM